ncbi:CYFIP-related Rac1 interactor A-like isoform X4 [Anolis sagrei]|uniref:CYFIP-related Rac1 interactor A-like isoform X4 n=1 Tax=Anolis sagrei TaxID=38937 RepID=UPI00351FC6FF
MLSWKRPRPSWPSCSPTLEPGKRSGRPSKTPVTCSYRRRHGTPCVPWWPNSSAFTSSPSDLMTNPAIQNDFSYYRRTISRNRINNLQLDVESEVNNEMANRMSLFYAEATPMLKTLNNATTKFVSENKTLPIEDTTDCLSTMACVCRVMLETPEYRSRFTNTETLLFCMRVMVGVIILYDHVHPVGAFAKTSKIDMKGCIKVLKDQPSNSTEGLLNALRYTTRHLNDDTTSKQIRTLLQ